MSENIKDKVVLITGASSGMGAATARQLIQFGARVVLAARREDRLKSMAAELGDNCLYVKTDVGKRADLDNLVKKTISKFAHIDVLWNNAGIMPLSFFEEGKVEEWERMIDINIKGVLYGINAVLPYMLKRGQGHIISTSSLAGLHTFSGSGVYCSTKYAVRAIMETLRKEIGTKIKITTLYPGAVTTELGYDTTSQKVAAYYGDLKDLPRMSTEAIVNAVVYAIAQPGNITVNDIMLRPLGITLD